MSQRLDLRSIMIIGSGPIVIGQACEFDYSGTQACKALRSDGYRVILVNSNPATIMTDPETADVTYIEPLSVGILERIIERERPDALLPTVGGQTGLNASVRLAEEGILDRYGVEMIGATLDSVRLAEDRALFRDAMVAAGLAVPLGGTVTSVSQALLLGGEIGYPVLVRPSFTLGGTGGGVAADPAALERAVDKGLRASPVGQVLVEQSVLGWKEFELEVMRDGAGNFVVVCTIENLDPMGVHTGDSITVAPAMTLTDREYQRLRDMARRVMDVVGLSTGGSNVQFAADPADGRPFVIEMNPRVSRSSALASKATGFPIAKLAALVAVGHTLDEIDNDITRETPASFEPSLDYVVVKVPRFAFEKFPGADETLGPQMKSVGETMAIGDTFAAALNKALRGLEIGIDGFGALSASDATARLAPADGGAPGAGGIADSGPSGDVLARGDRAEDEAADGGPDDLRRPVHTRLLAAARALAAGEDPTAVARATGYDPWFVREMEALVDLERHLALHTLDVLPVDLLVHAKRSGFSDAQIARLCSTRAMATSAADVRALRGAIGLKPIFRRVDTCAAEFEAHTPYLYSAYAPAGQDEARPSDRSKVIVLGGGPNRIGQGIEFDYCCVHACQALADMGHETVMVNCNPETVSTDYDTADRLYFEPLTLEDVLAVCETERPDGVLVQFGGQTPLNLAHELEAAGVPIWGTSPDTIDLAEDRERFGALLTELDIPQPEHGIAHSEEEAIEIAERIGFPVVVRPSYVLGGRAMAIVYSRDELDHYLAQAASAAPGRSILIDSYLEDAYEVDVDAVADGERVVIGGVMQHIEEAGVHSGDSAMVLPPYRVSSYHLAVIGEYVEQIGLALGVRGLMNAQFAIKDDVVYVLEVNPRSSRTVPFVAKATGVPLARIAAEVAAGRSLAQIGFTETPPVDGFFVKEVVLPFDKLPGAVVELGPEMRSTGEVMGHASHFGHAFAKAALAAGQPLPTEGTVLVTVNDFDKAAAGKIARDLHRMGFGLMATAGTADWLEMIELPVERVRKVSEGSPHVADAVASGRVALVISTPLGPTAYADGQAIRRAAIGHRVPLLTTLSAASAAVSGIRALRDRELKVRGLQEHYRSQPRPASRL
ncbi:MAG: carbamoyl-phosphate synthase large subunit [Anaerolineae bacterium]